MNARRDAALLGLFREGSGSLSDLARTPKVRGEDSDVPRPRRPPDLVSDEDRAQGLVRELDECLLHERDD